MYLHLTLRIYNNAVERCMWFTFPLTTTFFASIINSINTHLTTPSRQLLGVKPLTGGGTELAYKQMFNKSEDHKCQQHCVHTVV